MPKRAKSAAPSMPRSKTHSSKQEPQPGSAIDFNALEETLRSSTLGRQFLDNYARQHPAPEIQLLLNAIAQLESAVIEPERRCPSVGILADLVALSEAIADTRRDLGDLGSTTGSADNPSSALDQIVDASTRATSDVLSALEELQNVSWTLRETGVAAAFCDRLDESAVDIYTACARQEMAGQQTAQAMNLLQHIEHRITAMVEHWDAYEGSSLLNAAKLLDVSDTLDRASAETDAAVSESQSRDEPAAPKTKGFELPEPLTLENLHALQRATLFG